MEVREGKEKGEAPTPTPTEEENEEDKGGEEAEEATVGATGKETMRLFPSRDCNSDDAAPVDDDACKDDDDDADDDDADDDDACDNEEQLRVRPVSSSSTTASKIDSKNSSSMR
jgi:hypothetical protein